MSKTISTPATLKLAALVVALSAGLVLGVAACGDPTPAEPVGRCDKVTCDNGTSCDPDDGQCKCGGEGGVICDAGAICDAQLRLCVSTACDETSCSGGATCDLTDGKCRCGTGGPECKPEEACDAQARKCITSQRCAGVTCAGALRCDPVDGECKCGGATCEVFESCQNNVCVADICAGVNCTGGTVCSPTDGQCRCGGAGGELCVQGDVCGCPGGGPCADGDRQCIGSNLCSNVICSGGSTCDPDDGKCKCGGPGGAICSTGQSCDVVARICLGGERCAGVACSGGLTCDPEDGRCKCGGLNGQVCLASEVCSVINGARSCVLPCDPRVQRCSPGKACYYDIVAKQAYCATAGDKVESSGCFSSPECALGLHCQQQPGQPGRCLRYCDMNEVGGGVCPQFPSAQICEDLRDTANVGAGACALK